MSAPGFNRTLDLSGFDRLAARLRKIANPNPVPLMLSWAKIIEEDNRRGILAGEDKMGFPMVPVKYRPIGPKSGQRLRPHMRNDANSRLRKGAFAGFGPHAAGLNNNLTSAEYRRLAGPPLAPRGAFSRVITNIRFAIKNENGHWFVETAWDDVVSTKGVPFLQFHFDGAGRLPRRDLRGVRAPGRIKAQKAAVAWMIDQIRSSTNSDFRSIGGA